MRKILVIGAGRSASSLIRYLLDKSSTENLFVIVADVSLASAQERIENHTNGKAITLDVLNEKARIAAVQEAYIVVSMLPARFHIEVARLCCLW